MPSEPVNDVVVAQGDVGDAARSDFGSFGLDLLLAKLSVKQRKEAEAEAKEWRRALLWRDSSRRR